MRIRYADDSVFSRSSGGAHISVPSTPAAPTPVAATGAIEISDVPAVVGTATGFVGMTLDGEEGGTIAPGATITIGGKTYTFVSGSSGVDEIQIGADNSVATSRLLTRINTDTAETLCIASFINLRQLLLTANTPGAAGNSIPISETSPDIFIQEFAGGRDAYTITVGGKTYTFTNGDDAGDNIDAAAFNSGVDVAAALMARINADTAETLCTGTINEEEAANRIDLTANTPGSAGNSITLSAVYDESALTAFSGGSD
jgi:hypothetical protein